jgi:hypothetical protein
MTDVDQYVIEHGISFATTRNFSVSLSFLKERRRDEIELYISLSADALQLCLVYSSFLIRIDAKPSKCSTSSSTF